jgi:hypothetical protein
VTASARGVSYVIAELCDEDGPYPLLECIRSVADESGEFSQESDDALHLALEVVQQGVDVVSGLSKDLLAVAGEEALHRVEQALG